jgi:hypothetical protein
MHGRSTRACALLLIVALCAACSAETQKSPNQIAAGAGSSGYGASAVGGAGAPSSAGASGTGTPLGRAGAPSAGNTGGSAGRSGIGGVGGTAASAGTGAAGTAGATPPMAGAGGSPTVDVPCNPADKGPDATPVANIGTGSKPAGMFATAVENDPGIADQTIFRPEPLGMIKHPILTWGNGACFKSNSQFTEFLLQFAAEGIVVIADGKPGASGSSSADGAQLIKAIDWAEKENERPCSKYYHKLDLGAIAVSGQSCGGLMAINASDDKRVTTSMPMNSGLMARDQTLYAALHGPMAIINGGESDIAYANGNADFEAINNIPIMVANTPVGHGGTYNQDNGGAMAKLAIAWLRWQLLKDQGATGKGMFIGDACGFCNDSAWDIKWKMKPQ